MKKINDALAIINQLMSENDKVLFNVFYLIAEDKNSSWVTDGESYIVGQTNANLPLWIWMKDDVGEEACREIEEIITERLEINPRLKITADATKIKGVLQKIANKRAINYEAQVPMVIYRCNQITNSKKASGRSILSNESHREILEKFITGMVYDLAKRPMEEGEAEGFAEGVTGSENFYLWEDDRNVVSMAMIAHRTSEFARINTVYTDAEQRGKGYAGMLVGEVTQKILDEGRIPMLYTEQDNVCSNATYRRIGYEACGELTQFAFCEL